MNGESKSVDNVVSEHTPDPKPVKYVEIGCRVPKDYFVTKGRGESDITRHAGSYHLALREAGIEQCNIMTYSSIMPGIATEKPRPKHEDLTHGCVLESIIAEHTSPSGSPATAGIIYGWLYDKKTKKRFGGLVCEHNGEYTKEEITGLLKSSIRELYENGYSEQFDLLDENIIIESFTPQKKFGTALVAICFTSHVIPIRGDVPLDRPY